MNILREGDPVEERVIFKECLGIAEGMFFGREKAVMEAGRVLNKVVSEPQTSWGRHELMAQKEWEDRLDMNEKEIRELKEMMLSLLKSMENLKEEVKECSRVKLREESCASDGSGLKGKEKIRETEMTPGFVVGSSDRSKYKKLEIPVFNGENPETWIYRAEHYFDINELADEDKVKVAVVGFGSDEVNWFCWSNNRKKVKSWEDLKRRMFEHFKTPGEGSLGARLIRIKQDGGYGDYLKKFLEYSAPLPGMAESVLIDAFITGLETNLQAEVKSRHPVTLEECIREAQMGKTNQELMFFITNEDEELGTEEEKEDDVAKGVELGSLEIEGGFEISLRTILGFTSKGTTNCEARFENKFGVTIGDGTTLEGNRICKTVEVKLPELTIVADFLVIELGGVDLVLGMQWLSTTGFMEIHWPSMTMAGTSQVILKGDPSLTKAECSLKTISKTWEEEDQGFLIEFQKIEIEVDSGVESEKEEEGEESRQKSAGKKQSHI
ncbi:retrotransposon protein [Cucumis melo var. makuwa]|uniref:Retrotransposon protein n=1 Tax=Cucumis melo var. makuwa TaxID=1194695 RepID=A0A5A7UG89_CUCMM|nr:retrotransposon protein [Cucumis melo var. makuwa]